MNARVRTAALALTLAPALAAGQAPTPSPSPQMVFPSGTELVTVDVVVVDKAGRPVPGLTQADFTIREDGAPRAIESFEMVEVPVAPDTPVPAAVERPRASTNTQPPPARTFVIVFDEAHLTPTPADAAKRAIEKFLREGTRPGDRVTIVPTAGGAWWTDTLPEGREDLIAVLGRLDGRAPRATASDHVTDWEALRIHVNRDDRVSAMVQRRFVENGAIPAYMPGERGAAPPDALGEGHPLVKMRAAEVYNNSVARRRATLRTLDAVLESLVGMRGRKAVLLVSQGFVHEPSLVEMHRVLDAARRANTAIHFVDARGLAPIETTLVEQGRLTQSNDLDTAIDQARYLAEGTDVVAANTGGQSFKNTNDISRAFERLSRESGIYYLVGYAPANMRRDGKFRKIEVKVARPGVEVRARRGYVLPRENDLQERVAEARDPALPAPPPPAPDDASLPLRLAAYALNDSAGGKVRVVVAGEAAASTFAWEAKGDRFEDALDTTVMLIPRAGTEVKSDTRLVELSLPGPVKQQVEQGWLPVLRDFELEPGVYQARAVVRERNAGRVGTVRHVFEVPAAGVFRATTPVLTDMLQPADGSLPRPSLLARRTFARGGRLFAQFEAVNAAKDATGATRVAAGHVLRRADGTVLSQQAPTPLPPGPDGRLSRMLSISLRTAAPGPHELALTVRDEVTGRTWVGVEPFDVADAAGAAALGVPPPVTGGPPAAAPAPAAFADPRAALALAERHALSGAADAHRWAVAAALLQEASLRNEEGRRRLAAMAHERPDDPDVQLALAALEERDVDASARKAQDPAPAGSASLPEFQRQGVRDTLLRAVEKRYRAVLAVRPDDPEARLRLGRVLQQRGDAEARQHLQAAAQVSDPGTRSLAHLFLGEMHEASGRLTDAIAAYRAAISASPATQAARIALSQALMRSGDPAAAREALATGLSADAGLDPLVSYEHPALRLGVALATALGKEGVR